MSKVIRLNEMEKLIFSEFAKKYNISLSDAFHGYIASALKHIPLEKVVEDISLEKARELMLAQKLKEFRKVKSQYYTIANLQKTIYNIGMSNFFNSGEINKEMITHIVDMTTEIITFYPQDIQEKMKEEVKHLGKYKNPEHVKTLLSNIQLLLNHKEAHK